MSDPEARHRQRRERYEAVRRADASRARRLVRWRGVAFLAAVAAGLGAEWTGGELAAVLAVAALGALAAFVVLVVFHRRVRRRARWHGGLADLAAEGLARRARDWEALPDPGEAGAAPGHPFAADLDVLGPASLRRLLSTPATPPGRETTRDWLLSPTGPEEIRRRQEAVGELADHHVFREELAARGRLAGEADADAFRRFLGWCEGDAWLEGRPLLVGVARILPAATALLAFLQAGGLVAEAWWALGPVAMLGVVGIFGSGLGRRVGRATAGEAELERYADLLEDLAGIPGEAEALAGIRTALAGGDGPAPDAAAADADSAGSTGAAAGSSAAAEPAPDAIRRLGRIAAWAEVRRSGLLHFLLQVLLLWDVHVLRALERWRSAHGARVRAWLAALGRGEALCALATLQADHPDWCRPAVDPDGEAVFEARGLDHALLTPERSVANDVTVGPPGTFLLVTGSNMSGKSTLLRAVGLAVVLARAGGPVPARRCSMPLLRVHTVMRVQDSLAEGVSQYMAELRRVRRVVAAARGEVAGAAGDGSGPGSASPSGEPVLYLLDEPLQGTNEAERRVALRTVLRHLLRTGAVGAVATHDLRLHEVEDLEAAARPVHLTGTVEEGADGPRLTFDYRLREGPATSTNALDLLRAVGLGEEGAEGGA